MSEDRKGRYHSSGESSGDRQIPQAGEVLCGVYRLDRMLGWGAVGIVYAAWHMELRRPCAIKILHPNFVEHKDVRERFRREALSAFKLNHPHIIKVSDYREDQGGWPVMVMEMLYGESLRQRLSRGALPLPFVERLFYQMCDAMTLAHQHGIVHRDLKPENIFLARLSPDAGDFMAGTEISKILDFGISKVTEQPEMTAMHVLLGSPSYMSPEQARGDARAVDARADIFSLGVILFECLTGRKAFVAADPEAKRMLILDGAVPYLREVNPDLPAALDDVIHKACAVRPEARYQSAAELLDGIRRALLDPRRTQALQPQAITGGREPRQPQRTSPAGGMAAPSGPRAFVADSSAEATVLTATPVLPAAPQRESKTSMPALRLPEPFTATVQVDLPGHSAAGPASGSPVGLPVPARRDATPPRPPAGRDAPPPAPQQPAQTPPKTPSGASTVASTVALGRTSGPNQPADPDAPPPRPPLAERALASLALRLSRFPVAQQRVRRFAVTIHGREMLVVAPLIFVLVFVVLGVFDLVCNPPQGPSNLPVEAAPIKIIDSQH